MLKINVFSNDLTLRLSVLCVLVSLSCASYAENEVMLKPLVISAPNQQASVATKADTKQARQPVPVADAADYLKTFPGFAVIRNGGANGEPVLRGMFGSRIGVLTNDAPIYGGCGGRMDPPSSYISPELYDEIEVIKGPQSVKYGGGFSAGVVRFNRKQLYFSEPTVTAHSSLLFGSFGRADQTIDATIGNSLGYLRLNANHAQANDYKDGSGRSLPSQWKKWNIDFTLGWTPTLDTNLEFTAGTADGEARYATRGMDGSQFKRTSVGLRFQKTFADGALTAINAQLNQHYTDHIMDNYSLRPIGGSMMPSHGDHDHGHGDHDHEHVDHDHGHGDHDHGHGDHDHGHGDHDHGHGDHDHGDHDHGHGDHDHGHGDHDHGHGDHDHDHGDHDKQPMKMVGNPDRKILSGKLSADWDFVNWQLTTGVDFSRDIHTSRGAMDMMKDPDVSNKDRFTDTKINQYGIFAEGNWQQSDKAKLVFGGRFDHNSNSIMNEKSPTTSNSSSLIDGFVRYEITPVNNLSSYVGLGYTQRAADFWEINRAVANNLNPEKTLQLDYGINYQGNGYSIWSSAYLGKINDFMLIDYTKNGKPLRQVNSKIAGFEAGADVQLLDNLTLAGSFAYAWGKNSTEHEALPQIPPFESKLSLTYQQDNWNVSTLVRSVAKQGRIAIGKGNVVGKDFEQSKAFTTFAVNGAYRFNKYIELNLGVDNIFNKTYQEHLNKAGVSVWGLDANTPINEPGRTFWLKLNMTY